LEDADKCNNVKDKLIKEACMYTVAVDTFDLEVCEKITIEDNRDKCVDKVYERCEQQQFLNPNEIPYYCQEGVLPPNYPEDAMRVND